MKETPSEITARTTTPRPKDRWDKADVVLKGIVSLLVGMLLFYGNQRLGGLERSMAAQRDADAKRMAQAQMDESRRQTLVQMAAARQSARLSLKSQVFGQFLTNLLDAKDFPHRIRLLELLGLNFGNAVQLKPLFEGVDADLLASDLDDSKMREYQTDLRDVARRLIRYQLEQIRGASGNVVSPTALKRNESVEVEDFPGTLELTLLDKEPDGRWITVGANSPDLWEGTVSFNVEYYDMPFVDYSTTTDGMGVPLRYSVVLLDAGGASDHAQVAVVVLPDVFELDNTFFFEDQLMEYVEDTKPDEAEVFVAQ